MVDRLRANGEFVKSYLDDHQLTPEFGYRKLILLLSGPGHRGNSIDADRVLENLKGFPVWDERSRLISNLRGYEGDIVNVLVVPQSCPDLLTGAVGAGLTEEQTYLVRVFGRDEYIIPVLVDNPTSAEYIASAVVSKRDDIDRDLITVSGAKLVSTEEFITEVLKLRRSGNRLSPHILRYLETRGYGDQFQEPLDNSQ